MLWLLIFGALNIWISSAYVTIDESDAVQIQEQINSTVDLTLDQKKEKSNLFYKLARKRTKDEVLIRDFLINEKLIGLGLNNKFFLKT